MAQREWERRGRGGEERPWPYSEVRSGGCTGMQTDGGATAAGRVAARRSRRWAVTGAAANVSRVPVGRPKRCGGVGGRWAGAWAGGEAHA